MGDRKREPVNRRTDFLFVQHYPYCCSFTRLGSQYKDFSAMVGLNYSFAEREAQTPSPLFSCKSWFENSFETRFGNALSLIGYVNINDLGIVMNTDAYVSSSFCSF